MNQAKEKINYQIVDDPELIDKQYHITDQERASIEEASKLLSRGDKSDIPLLQKIVEQNPRLPQLKNDLASLYIKLDNFEKGLELNRLTVKEHPEYLFAKLNMAAEHINNNMFEEALDILGENLDLQDLYPNRKTFDIQEVKSYLQIACQYCTATNEFSEANSILEILEELDPEDEITKQFKQLKQIKELNTIAHRKKQEKEKKIAVYVDPATKLGDKKDAPKFNHPEIEELYKHEITILPEKLMSIINLPRESVIADLELVLNDSIERFNHFSSQDNIPVRKLAFPLHAVMLLGEIRAEDSLGTIFKVLSQDEDYFDFYFGDWLEKYFWDPIYQIAQNHLDAVNNFMIEPGKHTFAKNLFVSMMEQIALHQPERKTEVVDYFNNWLEAYSHCTLEDNIIDSDLNAHIICSLLELNVVQESVCTKVLLEREWVNEIICGSYHVLMEDALEERKGNKMMMMNIFDRYQVNIDYSRNDGSQKIDKGFIDELFSGFASASNAPEQADDNNQVTSTVPELNYSKIGRNDPCPCGSGIKYKKCCLNK